MCVGAALAGSLVAQAPVRLAQETPLLKEPGGVRIASLLPGTRIVPGRVSSGHLEVTLQGWIFTASTRPDKREGFDLSVAAAAGENIRAAPDGPVLARAVNGALFDRVRARGGWSEVRRSGWVRRALLAPPQTAQSAVAPAAPAPLAPSVPAPLAPSVPAPLPPPASPDSARALLRAGAALTRTPDGAALATLSTPAEASVVERKGDWVKVRVDAWVKRGDVEGALAPPPAITAAMLRENPDRYVGQTVAWRVQFLAHQQADELRPEMPHGARYLLARGPLPETGFVYVLVSRDQAAELQGLKALEELAVTVTLRSARTRYLATPVVELVRLNGGR